MHSISQRRSFYSMLETIINHTSFFKVLFYYCSSALEIPHFRCVTKLGIHCEIPNFILYSRYVAVHGYNSYEGPPVCCLHLVAAWRGGCRRGRDTDNPPAPAPSPPSLRPVPRTPGTRTQPTQPWSLVTSGTLILTIFLPPAPCWKCYKVGPSI